MNQLPRWAEYLCFAVAIGGVCLIIGTLRAAGMLPGVMHP